MNPVRRRAGMIALLVTVLLVQTAFFPHVRVLGVIPDAVVVAVIAVASREGPEVGAVFGFTAGVVIDLFLEVPLGLSALSYVIVGYGVGALHSGFLRDRWWLGPVLGGGGSLCAGALFVLSGLILGQEHLFALRTLAVIPTRALEDACLALVVFPLTARLLGPVDESLLPYRT